MSPGLPATATSGLCGVPAGNKSAGAAFKMALARGILFKNETCLRKPGGAATTSWYYPGASAPQRAARIFREIVTVAEEIRAAWPQIHNLKAKQVTANEDPLTFA
ncbi:MAG: hypothetical protein POH28_00055 [Acidocella sp.]|nr:hypothetical protein [Acidocella sp.]